MIYSEPINYPYNKLDSECSLCIISAGFEDRAFQFISKQEFSASTKCILINFKYNVDGNDVIHEKFEDVVFKKFAKENIFFVTLNQHSINSFEKEFDDTLMKLPKVDEGIWLDISGVPSYGICMILKSLRHTFSAKRINIFYTSAEVYYPTKSEIDNIRDNLGTEVEFLSPTMALEMSEVLLLESFSGHRSKEGTSCLALFAGYDASRSSGVIESINPSTLLLIYGKPGCCDLDWRLDLSKQQHKRFEGTRRSASEDVSTLYLTESLEVLENYYDYLFEDFDFTIAPICSKMQSVAVYLFWEKYKEVQLVFPLPIGYSTNKKPSGIGCTYMAVLEPLSAVYRMIS